MFWYCPPKGNAYGQALRPANLPKAWQKTQFFLENYFESAEPKEIKIRLFFNPYCDTENHTQECKKKVTQIFGSQNEPELEQWDLTSDKYQQAVDFILGGLPWPKQPSDPIWLSLTFWLEWKVSALPNVDWPDEYLKSEKLQRSLFTVYLRNHGFVVTLLTIPLSSKEPASYEFLRKFSDDAPFKMNPKHFRIIEPVGKNNKLAQRKPDAETFARLQRVLT